ncbi:sulfur carrier protein ThiS [Arcobacter vandammei]|uniref:sulfur carrier protein ThiS n=1 Tax=Arcobacter vandammei TaxID=2782243 RepID=UPI0018DF0363
MKITVNGEIMNFKDNSTLLEIIKELKIEDKVMAAAINMDIVKKDIWNTYEPKENDVLELLNFVGGG